MDFVKRDETFSKACITDESLVRVLEEKDFFGRKLLAMLNNQYMLSQRGHSYNYMIMNTGSIWYFMSVEMESNTLLNL